MKRGGGGGGEDIARRGNYSERHIEPVLSMKYNAYIAFGDIG